jgi:hypothetical protein
MQGALDMGLAGFSGENFVYRLFALLLLFMRGVRCGEVKKNDNTHFRINTIGE